MAKEPKKLSSNSVAILKSIADGLTYEQVLGIYPQLTYLDIFKAAREALEMAGEVSTAYQERMMEIRHKYPRAYEKWTGEEDTTLDRLVRSGCGVDEIADRLQRQPSAIRSRMQKRNLVEDEAAYW